MILKSQHVEHLKSKCVIKENYTPPSSKFSAILNSMLREKMPKFDLVSGDHAIRVVITATIISTGMTCVLRYCQIWMGRRSGDSWWHGPAICQNLGANYRGCCEANTEANTFAIRTLNVAYATRTLKSTLSGFGT